MKKNKINREELATAIVKAGIIGPQAADLVHSLTERRGGARPGSGQKKRYGEPTVSVCFRVPASKAEEFKGWARAMIKANFLPTK